MSDRDLTTSDIAQRPDAAEEPRTGDDQHDRAGDPHEEEEYGDRNAIDVALQDQEASRLVMGWSIVIDSWTVPMWVSWIGLVVAGGLSYYGARLAMRS